MNIISKNFFDICVSTLAFYLCGYSFSVKANGGLIGQGKFLSLDFGGEDYLDWFYKYSLCSASITIVSGSLAERCYVDSYIVFSILMTTLIYPIASSWTIGEGWLLCIGFHDAAGAGSIHMLGGCCASSVLCSWAQDQASSTKPQSTSLSKLPREEDSTA